MIGQTFSRSGQMTAILTSLGLFLAALLPRALSLGAFATADEAKWVYRSAQFLGALQRGDLADTMVNLTPAVITTWLGSLGLAAYHGLHRAELALPLADWLASLPQFRAELDVLVAVRWPMVLMVSAGIVAMYHLAARLVDRRAALLFALLLAFDPQFIALSRVLGHDAPAGLFVGLSLLAFLVAVRTTRAGEEHGSGAGKMTRIGWMILSGALAGLAWLSKSPTLFLIPFVCLVALIVMWRRRDSLGPWMTGLVAWGVAGWIVFVLVWPAAWRDPVGAPYAVVHNAFLSATDRVEAEAEGYWQVPDLGPLYYPVNGAFKLSPLAALGMLGWLGLVVARRRKASASEWALLAFALLFTLFMTLGGKRSNRYILPAWPALYLLAAIGLRQISNIKYQMPHTTVRITRYALISALAILLIVPPVAVYPYYLTYFNPLLGGALTAPRLVKIGWGEGLDQVGRWLDSRPDAPTLRVGSYYASALAPFFAGKISEVTAAELDYVVLYRKQMQAGNPSPTMLRYYASAEPSHTVRLAGIEYAWVYAGPALQPALANEPALDIGILPKPISFRADRPFLPIGQPVTVEVLWLSESQLPPDPSRLSLVPAGDVTSHPEDRSGQVWAQALARLERRPDGLVISRHQLMVPDNLPRGSYGLLVDGRPLGITRARQFTIPPVEERLDVNFDNQLRLVGYIYDAPAVSLALVWQAAPRAWADYTVFLHLVDAVGNRVAGVDGQPLVPTSQWARGEVMSMEYSEGGQYAVPVPADLPSGRYRLVVGLYRDDNGQRLPVLNAAGAPVDDGVTLPETVAIGEREQD